MCQKSANTQQMVIVWLRRRLILRSCVQVIRKFKQFLSNVIVWMGLKVHCVVTVNDTATPLYPQSVDHTPLKLPGLHDLPTPFDWPCVFVFVYNCKPTVCVGVLSTKIWMCLRSWLMFSTEVYAYCSTNRICTWWCQPRFFKDFLNVLQSVRQDHLAHSTETRNATIVVALHWR